MSIYPVRPHASPLPLDLRFICESTYWTWTIQARVYHRTYHASKTKPDTLFRDCADASSESSSQLPCHVIRSAWCHALSKFCQDLPELSCSTTNAIIGCLAATFVHVHPLQTKASISHGFLVFFIVNISSSKIYSKGNPQKPCGSVAAIKFNLRLPNAFKVVKDIWIFVTIQHQGL
jgi:hypothetical protein